MTVRVYRSTDASAPVLTGSVGTLTALLDAILVNGYGSLVAAGWTIAFTTTNKRAYKQNLTGSNNTSGMFLYVDDTGPGVGAAKEARACGFETMSAITPTGTGQFPTPAQSTIGSGYLVVRKSNTADATSRAWTCIANGQTVYLFIESGDTITPLATTTFVFGDFKSYKASDQYAVCIVGRTTENSSSSSADALQCLNYANSVNVQVGLANAAMGHFAARSWTGAGGSTRLGKMIDTSKFWNQTGNYTVGTWSSDAQTVVPNSALILPGRYGIGLLWPAPNGPDGAIWLSPFYLCHNGALRGYFAGLWCPLHDRPLGHSDTFTVSSGNLSGKSFIAQSIHGYYNSSANAESGLVIVESSDTWS